MAKFSSGRKGSGSSGGRGPKEGVPEYIQDADVEGGERPPKDNAGLILRWGAYILDSIVIEIIVLGMFILFLYSGLIDMGFGSFLGYLNPSYENMLNLVFFAYQLSTMLVAVVYFTLFEASRRRATPWKMVLNIEVVDKRGEPIGLKTAFLRNIFRLVWAIPCIGVIVLIFEAILVYSSQQRIGDMVADTYVVKESQRSYGSGGAQYQDKGLQASRHSQSQGAPMREGSSKISGVSSSGSSVQADWKGDTQRCDKCGAWLSGKKRVCPHCGNDLTNQE